MRIAARDGDDATLDRLVAGVEPGASDAALLRGAGLALFERAEQTNREELSNKALELLDRAIAARPGDAEAAWAHSKLAAKLRR
jgi:hypothetical protein